MDKEITNLSTYVLGVDLYPSDKVTALPVEQTNTTLALNAKEHATTETLGLEANVQRSLLLEVAEDLDAHSRLADGVIFVVVFRAPFKVES